MLYSLHVIDTVSKCLGEAFSSPILSIMIHDFSELKTSHSYFQGSKGEFVASDPTGGLQCIQTHDTMASNTGTWCLGWYVPQFCDLCLESMVTRDFKIATG